MSDQTIPTHENIQHKHKYAVVEQRVTRLYWWIRHMGNVPEIQNSNIKQNKQITT